MSRPEYDTDKILECIGQVSPKAAIRVCRQAISNWVVLMMGGRPVVGMEVVRRQYGWNEPEDAVLAWSKALKFWQRRAKEERRKRKEVKDGKG